MFKMNDTFNMKLEDDDKSNRSAKFPNANRDAKQNAPNYHR